MCLGRRSPAGLLAIVVSTAIEPPYVCGAATCSLRWHTEIQSGHAARGQPRWDAYSGEKGKNPLLGVVCLLTRCRWQTRVPVRGSSAAASAANAEGRVWARGIAASQAATRLQFSAAAISRGISRVFTN